MEHGCRKRALKKRSGHGRIASAATATLCVAVVVFLSLLPGACDRTRLGIRFHPLHHCLPIIATVKFFVLIAVGCVAPARAWRANKARGNDPINLDNKIT